MSGSIAQPEAAAELFADPPLVGRQGQLKRLEALLDRPPALAVVRGEPGSGKTSLLAAFSRVAAARGWRIMQAPALRPDTDRDTLVRRLRVLAGLPETLVLDAGNVRGEQLLGLPSDETGRTGAVLQAEGTLLAGLSRGERTILLIDGFRAAKDVEQWLLDELLADLRAAAAPVVAVVAGRTVHVREAVTRADEVLNAELPTEAELRQHFSALGALLHPPAEAAEVDVLAAEVASLPHLIGPLVRALRYARTDA